MTTCILNISTVDPKLVFLPSTKIVFKPKPDVIRGAGTAVMLPQVVTMTTDAMGVGSIALAPGRYAMSVVTPQGQSTTEITVPDAVSANLGDLIDAPIGEWEFSELQQLRLEARAWAQEVEDSPVQPGLFSAFHWMRKARLWAIGTLPGGAGTKSAKEWAEVSEASANRVDLGALDAAVAAAERAVAALPALVGNALRYLRINAAENGYDVLTAPQLRTNIGAAASGANSDISSLAGLTTPLSVAQGGTGSATASGARTSIGAAASGVNNDITSLSGLTTPLSVAQGGTGANDAAGARTKIGAAAAGANSDITSLDGLTTALSVEQGGTGSTTAEGALSNLGLTIPASVINRGPDPENRIINGAFDFWQRGTSFTAAGYTADRWRISFTGGAFSLTKVNETLGVLLGANNPDSFARLSVSGQTLSSHFAYIEQAIEGVRSYAGQTVTVLGWARRVSGAGNMTAAMYQVFGTGGSPSPSVNWVGQQVELSSNWAPFAVTFNVPSVSGKTLGTNGNDYALLRFFASAGSSIGADGASLGLQTIGIDLWGIHIRLGTHTTAAVDLYKPPEKGPELARCQRYYHAGAVRWDGQATNGVAFSSPVYFPTVMRVAPVISEANITNIAFPTTSTAQSPSNTGYFSRRIADATAAGAFIANYSADAEL